MSRIRRGLRSGTIGNIRMNNRELAREIQIARDLEGKVSQQIRASEDELRMTGDPRAREDILRRLESEETILGGVRQNTENMERRLRGG